MTALSRTAHGERVMEWNAYHFVGETLRDGRPVPPDGVTLYHEGPLKMCRTGLHASKYAWQALQYAPGPTLCRVHCGGEIVRGEDKLVCTERTIIARIDATVLLYAYARACALDVVRLWNAPDVAVEYLLPGDEGLRAAAQAAARGPARGTGGARDAAWAT